jgi:single-strand DNA-binding protein
MSYNKVIVMGNLTRDPELRYIASGTAVCDLGLAINDKRKVGDKWEEETTFIDVTCWARTAEVCAEYLKKGSQVLIDGKLKMENWQNKEGNKRSKIKIVCNEMRMTSNKKNSDVESTNTEADEPTVSTDDDIPF